MNPSQRTRSHLVRNLFYSHLFCSVLIALAVSTYWFFTVRDSLRDNILARHQIDLQKSKQQLLSPSVQTALLELAKDDGSANKEQQAELQSWLLQELAKQPGWRAIGVLLKDRVRVASFSNMEGLQPDSAKKLLLESAGVYTSIAQELDVEGKSIGRLVASVSLEELDKSLAEMSTRALLGFIAAVLLSWILAKWLSAKARVFFRSITDRFGAIAHGKFDVKLEDSEDPELNRLSDAFNNMAQRLKTTLGERERALSELKLARDRLEQGMRDRVKELERLNALLRTEHEQRAQLEARLAEAAATDPLTQLLNRRAMLELLPPIGEHLKKLGKTGTFVLLDIDHFKQVNDTFGHDIGDKILRSVSELIRKELRADEAAARWGGEEFLMLWPEQSPAVAEQRANRLREILASQMLHPSLYLTVSMGIAAFNGEQPFEALKRADECLYRAKASGRNQVVVAAC